MPPRRWAASSLPFWWLRRRQSARYRPAMANQLQRSVNIFLGSVLATIGLTVPTMLAISHITGKNITLGVQHADAVLLPLTLVVSIVTFASGRTNVLQGA